MGHTEGGAKSAMLFFCFYCSRKRESRKGKKVAMKRVDVKTQISKRFDCSRLQIVDGYITVRVRLYIIPRDLEMPKVG